MPRSLLFALSLLAFASCQSEKPREQTNTAPPTQLAALEDKAAQQNAPPAASLENSPEADQAKAGKAATQQPQRATAIAKTRELKVDKPAKKEASKANSSLVKTAETSKEKAEPSKLIPNVLQTSSPPPPSHKNWDGLLQKHVSSAGTVNYKGLLADKAKLQAYLDELAANPAGKSWTRNEKLAYWINAYNAFTVKLILDHYPVSSITKIHGGKPWDVQWIKLGDNTYSLNNIENDIIRPQFKEPRIHFAVNCAARSCPPLLNRAWTADNLNRYLDQQARSFINNPKYNEIGPETVEISKIFEWYAADFGNIIDFLNKYSETQIQEDAKVSYKEYDWGLNE